MTFLVVIDGQTEMTATVFVHKHGLSALPLCMHSYMRMSTNVNNQSGKADLTIGM